MAFLRLHPLCAAAKCFLQPWDQAEQVSALTSLRGLCSEQNLPFMSKERYTNFVVCDIKQVLAFMSLTGDIKYPIFQAGTGPEHSDSCVTFELLAVTNTTSKAYFLQ